MSGRKIGFLILILLFGGVVELSWNLRESHYSFGPEGLRVLGGRFYGPSFEFEEIEERALPSEGSTQIEVRNAFGGVRVVPGEEPVLQARLRKVVFRPTEEKARTFAERIELQIEEDEGRFRVGTNREAVEGSEDVGFETHLELRVPSDTAIEVRNHHGAVEVRGVASARIRSAFESVRVESIEGPVSIDARQGAVEASGLGADLTLEARHGDVDVSDVAGQADLDVQHGGLNVREVGAVKARVSYGHVEVEEVAGDAVIHARHAEVRATDVQELVDIETTFADIRVEDVAGPVKARVEHGDVDLVPGMPITRSIDATSTHGEIRLQVPAGSRFDLDAESRHGELILDVPGLDAEAPGDGTPTHATGTMGGGGAAVTLRARGDIALETAAPAPPAEQE